MKLQLNASTKPHSADLISDAVVVHDLNSGLDLIGQASFIGAQHLVTTKAQFSDAFFDLRTGLAGEILQKFVNYQLKLTIKGEWQTVESNALRDFIRECNRGNWISFAAS